MHTQFLLHTYMSAPKQDAPQASHEEEEDSYEDAYEELLAKQPELVAAKMQDAKTTPEEILKKLGIELTERGEPKDEFDRIDEKFLDVLNSMNEMRSKIKEERAMLKSEQEGLVQLVHETVAEREELGYLEQGIIDQRCELESLLSETHDYMEILTQIPPSLHNKNQNEHYPMLRFLARDERYRPQYDACKYNLNRMYDGLREEYKTANKQDKMRIAACFYYKNFATQNMSQLIEHAETLVHLLKNLRNFPPDSRILESIKWLENIKITLKVNEEEDDEVPIEELTQ